MKRMILVDFIELWFERQATDSYIFNQTPTAGAPKLLKKGDVFPTPEKLKFYFGRFFLNSLEIVIFQ